MRAGASQSGVTRRALVNLRRAPWPAIVIAAVAVVVLVGWMIWRRLYAQPDLRLIDLAVYRAAGESLLDGRPLYDYLTPLPQFLPFTYPPFAAVVALPLALMSTQAANWLWSLATLAVLVWLVLVAFRPLLRTVPYAYRPVAAAALICAMAWMLPVRDCFRFGQVGIFLAALCLADCAVARPRWPRGVLIGFATAIKLTPGVFIVYLWVSGRRRAAVNAAVSFVVLEVFAAVVAPRASWAYWTDALFNSGRLGDNAGTSNQSLRGMMVRAFDPNLATALFVVAAVIVTGYAFWRARAASFAGDELRAVVIIGLLSVLVSPVSWIHHLAGWLPLAIGVVLGAGTSRRRWVYAVALVVFFSLEVPWWWHGLWVDGLPLALAQIVQNSFGLVSLVVLWALGQMAVSETRHPSPTDDLEPVRS